jgi:GT2 family glycosyltransferase
MKKGISVVVVTYNRPKDVMDTVHSLVNQSFRPLEIVVIDDGSNPPLSVKFDIKNLKLTRFDEEVGACNARNYGIKVAKGDYVAFIDDDAIADKYWLEEIQKGIEVGADILGGLLNPIYETSPPKWWNEKDFGYYTGIGNWGGWIWGANMVVRKEVFRKAGLFRSELGPQKGKHLGGEELDLINRAKSMGYRVLFMPKAIVYHKVKPHRMTLRHILRWEYYYGKSLKIINGYNPLKTTILLFLGLLSMANPKVILSEPSVRIKKIAWVIELFGQFI